MKKVGNEDKGDKDQPQGTDYSPAQSGQGRAEGGEHTTGCVADSNLGGGTGDDCFFNIPASTETEQTSGVTNEALLCAIDRAVTQSEGRRRPSWILQDRIGDTSEEAALRGTHREVDDACISRGGKGAPLEGTRRLQLLAAGTVAEGDSSSGSGGRRTGGKNSRGGREGKEEEKEEEE